MSAVIETRNGVSVVHISGERDPPVESDAETTVPLFNERNVATVEVESYSPSRNHNNHGNGETRLGHENGAFIDQENKLPPTRRLSSITELSRISQRLAVSVQRVYVTSGHGSRACEILKGIDLTLPKGQIYGLLGPSGCGKTTLLRCIVGRNRPQEGLVRVFGQVPGFPGSSIPGPGVGYMPQELTLYPEFTIGETLTFFGNLCGMEKSFLDERIDTLLGILDLPHREKQITKLSGGQQRRVSLAAALIHNPPLLILDEPTVGVDPLLRKRIWNYLLQFVKKEQMTVIVTTHYTEEAHQANIVGLMRSGRMLAEDSPDRLLARFQCKSLEKVFEKLCEADNSEKTIVREEKILRNGSVAHEDSTLILDLQNEKIPISELPPDVKHTLVPVEKNGGLMTELLPDRTWRDSLSRAFALLMKNITRIRRNIPVLLFTFFVPSFQAILFCLCIGADPYALPVAVVNTDVHPVLSQQFLESIPNYTVVQRYYADLDEAVESVQRGETWGVINIKDNFTTALQYRFLLGFDADNDTIEGSTIDIHLDMTNQQIGFILQKTLYEAFQAFCEKILEKLNRSTALAQLPLRVREPIYGNRQPKFTQFMAPGIILCITYFMAVGLTAISIIMEFREGTMERCWVAGVKPFEVVVSHVSSQFCIMLVQVTLLLAFMFLVFKMPLLGAPILVVLLTLLQGHCGMTCGLVISSICSVEQSAMMLALGTFFPNLLLSGIIWPVQSMPGFIRYMSYGLPQTIATESLRCIMYRGWGIERYEVWLGFVVSIFWSCFFLLFATTAFRARK